jgi:hypothetical protein
VGNDAAAELARAIDVIERSYEYLLAYAAQGRQEDRGSDARVNLQQIDDALADFGGLAKAALGSSGGAPADAFLDAVAHDARVARGAVALVLSRPAISSLLVDNLNASVHLRTVLTDAFLLDQALRPAAIPAAQAQAAGSTPK